MELRILLVGMPRIVREMLERTIAEQPDMLLVGVAAREQLLPATRETRPDFVVVGVEGEEPPDDCRRLLGEQPHVRVLGLEANAGTAYLYELRPEMSPLGEVSPDDVVAAMRNGVGRE